jgi:hypothetical protein
LDTESSNDDPVDEGGTDADGRITLAEGDELFLDDSQALDSGPEGDDRIDEEQSDE